MPEITATEEYLPRYRVDEYATLHLNVVRLVTLPDGTVLEKFWRAVITPDDTLDTVDLPGFDTPPQPLIDAVAAARYPAAVARYESRKQTQGS